MQLTSLVRSFAEETGIFGLNLFQRKRSTLYIVVWCSIVLCCVWYTIQNIVSMTAKYLDEETVTFMQQKSDEIFTIPFTQLYFVLSPSNQTSLNLASVVNLENFDTNATLFRYTIDFLRRLSAVENRSRRSDIGESLSADSDLIEDLRSLVSSSRIPPLNELAKIVLLKLCESLKITIKYPSSSNETTVCVSERLNFARHYNEFAFVVSLDPCLLKFKQKYDTFSIRLDIAALKELAVELESANIAFPKSELLTSNFTTVSLMYLPLKAAKSQKFFLVKSGQYRNLNLAQQPCSDDPSRSAWCENLCESRLFYELHGCWAFLYAYQLAPLLQNVSGVRECNAGDYLRFLSVRPSPQGAKFEACISKCVKACTRVVYFVDDMLAASELNSNTLMEATISVRSHDYPLFDERLAKDLETFFGELGGALGLLLGVSFAGLVHVPLFFLDVLISYFIKGKNNAAFDSSELDAVKWGSSTTAAVSLSKLDELVGAVVKIGVDLENIRSRLQTMEQTVQRQAQTRAPKQSKDRNVENRKVANFQTL